MTSKTEFFTTLAQKHPCILLLEDLHWADQPTLEYLGFLSARLGKGEVTSPLLLIETYRSEEVSDALRTWLDQLELSRGVTSMKLEPLPCEQTTELTGSLLGSYDPELNPWLYQKSGGNPFFLLELMKSLIESHTLRQDQRGSWRFHEPERVLIPESLRELIHARLRRRPPQTEAVLQAGAVLGNHFELRTLRALLRHREETLINRLDELRGAGLLCEREGRYQFSHELIRQAVYSELSSDRRRLWHRRVGETLERLYPKRLDELSGELAQHFEQAQLWDKAIAYAERAGLQAQKGYAYGEALKFLTKALELFDHLEKPLSLHRRCLKLELVSRYLSENVFPTISDIMPALEEVQAAVSEMTALAQELGDRVKLCDAYQGQARVEVARGRRETAREALYQALKLSQGMSDPSIVLVLKHIGRLYRQLGDYSQALEAYRRTGEIGAALGDPSVQGKALADIAVIQLFLGQLIDARQNMEQAHELVQAARNRRLQASVLNNLGLILCEKGEWQSAQNCYEQAYQLMEETGDQRGLGVVLINLGTLRTIQGRYSEAIGYFERVLSLLSAVGTKGLEIEALSEKGRAHWGRGELGLALDCSARAVRLLEEQRGTIWEAQRFYFTHYQILQANQRTDEARVYLQKAYDEVLRVASEIREETLRTSFLQNVSINRQIVQAWQDLQAKS